MHDEREELVRHIMDASRDFYHRSFQLGGDREWADVDLTMPQLKLLFMVAAGQGVTMTQLARNVGMTLSTATGVADRLIGQGFARRENDPADRRLVLLHATDAGTALVDRLIQFGQAQLMQITERLTIDELRLLAQAHDLVRRAIIEISTERQQTGASALSLSPNLTEAPAS